MEVRRELTKIGPVLPSCRDLLLFSTRLKMKMLLSMVETSLGFQYLRDKVLKIRGFILGDIMSFRPAWAM